MIRFAISTSAIRGDLSKLDSLVRYGFQQLEIGFFDERSMPKVMEFALRQGLTYGFHDPLPRPPDFDFPFLTDPNEDRRGTTLASLRRTMETAVKYGALYVVGHLPSVIWQPTPGLGEEKVLALAQDSCTRLSSWSEEMGVPVLLENVGPNPYFHRAESFLEIFRLHPRLGFCLDIGHLHLTALFHDFDPLAFAEALSPYISLIHVYNATLKMYREFHHVPVHPSQSPQEGWADIPAILHSALKGAPSPTIVFEHTPQYTEDEIFIAEGIEWVKRIVQEVTQEPL